MRMKQGVRGVQYIGILCIFGLSICINACSTGKLPLADLPQTTLPLCKQLSEGKLPNYESCYADVVAKDSKNYAGLRVEKGQAYIFTVHGNQFWYDKNRLNRPFCGESGSWLMNSILIFKDKKAPDSLWFSLIAEIEGENIPYDLCTDGNNTTMSNLSFGSSGMLFLYANDIECFYDNNQGTIRIEIQRRK